MKHCQIILLLIIFYRFSSHAQSVQFQLQRAMPCFDNPVVDSSEYYLISASDSVFTPRTNNYSGKVNLPGPGKYVLRTYDYDPDTNTEITIIDTGLHIHIIKEPKIVLSYTSEIHPKYYYRVCGKIAEGYQEDFYPNGNTRIRGLFLKGDDKDSLVTFYENGHMETRSYTKPGRFLIERYDSMGHIISIRRTNNANSWGPGKNLNYLHKDFFYSGGLKRWEKKKGYNYSFTEYYESGKVKNKQKNKSFTEFYDNGVVKIKCKILSKEKGYEKYTYTLQRNKFDSKGTLIEEQIFEHSDYFSNPVVFTNSISIFRSNLIIKWIKILDGKTSIIAENIEPWKIRKSISAITYQKFL